MNPLPTKKTAKIAISRCLIGEPVRYDGKSRFQPQLIKRLTQLFTLIPICPEVEIGLSVPRPPIHIVAKDGMLRAVIIEDPDTDLTVPLQNLAIEKGQLDIHGFILKGRSPSCGLDSTPQLLADGSTVYGSGIFARAFMKAHPDIPMIEAEQLQSPQQFERFAQRVMQHTNP